MKNHNTLPLLRHILFCVSALSSLLFFSIDAHSSERLIQQEVILPGPYAPIDLHDFVNQKRTEYQGKISIVPPKKIAFTGILKSLPQKKSTGYLYTALEVMQIAPVPTVEYQMFIAATDSEDTVISVYVDNTLVDAIQKKLSPESHATWFGYHIYTFSRGPAIVIDNVMIDNPAK